MITAPVEVYHRNLALLAGLAASPEFTGRLLGVHLEGYGITNLPSIPSNPFSSCRASCKQHEYKLRSAATNDDWCGDLSLHRRAQHHHHLRHRHYYPIPERRPFLSTMDGAIGCHPKVATTAARLTAPSARPHVATHRCDLAE